MKDRSPEEVVLEGLSPEEMAEMAEHAESLEAMALHLDDVEARLEALLEAAGIYEDLANEPIRALAAFESILSLDPFHSEALQSAERLAQEHEQWDSLAEIVIRRITQSEAGPHRVELYHQLATIQDEGQRELGNTFLTLQAAFKEDITNEQTAVALEKVARRAGRLNELLTFYNSIISELVDEEAKVELCSRLGRWYLELEHLDYATDCLNQALQIRPNHSGALKTLADVYRQQEQWEALGQLLTHFASVSTDVSEKRGALVDLGKLYEERYSDLASASASYRGALQLDPLCVEATDGLKRTGQVVDDWTALVASLEQQLAAQENTEGAVEILRALAEIHETQRGDKTAAIVVLRSIVELTPADGRALSELDTLLSDEERWEDLVSILELLCDSAPSERVRINVLMRLAMVLDNRLSRPVDAAEKLEDVVAIEVKNEVALSALERLYRDLERWEDLARTYKRQLEATEDSEARFDLFLELGFVAYQRLDDSRAAIEAWEGARAIDASDARILDGLSVAYEEVENWRQAVEALEQLIDVVAEPHHRVEPHYRLATILAEPMSDPRGAVNHLTRAINLDPNHRPSLIALKDLYIEREEWFEAARILEQLQDLTEGAEERSELLNDLGAINDIYLQNPSRAEECFVLGLDYDATNLAAAGNLVELFAEQKRYDEAAPLFEVILSEGNISLLERPQLHRVHFLRGQVSQALEDDQTALRAYKAASDIEPQHLPTLQGLAALQLKRGIWDRAFKTYQMILVRHREDLSDEEMVEVFHCLGTSAMHLGERRKALNMYEKALEVDADHVPTLEAILDFYERQGEWKKVIDAKLALLKHRPADERVTALTESAKILVEKLRDPDRALECLNQALELQPGSFPLLHKLVDIYTGERRWEEAIETIRRIAELDTDDTRLARCYRSIGVLYRDKLNKPDLAVESFERCLNHDATQLRAFEAIDRILTNEKNWVELETSYRRMLKRIQGKEQRELEINLWHFLGEIYRTRLVKLDAAADAFTMACNLEPQNIERQVILAELFEKVPGAAQRAIEKHQLLISMDPFRIESYAALAKLYKETQQYDKAWCLCSALTFLGKADPDEKRFYIDYKGGSVQRARGAVGAELWLKKLVAPDEDLYLGKTFETILPPILSAHVQPIKAFGLKKKHRFDPLKGSSSFGEDFRWAAQTLGMAPPELYLKDDLGVPLLFALTEPVASIADESLLATYEPNEVRFELARHLTWYRGEHYLRCVEPAAEDLRSLFLSALRLVRPSAPVPSDVSGMLFETVEQLQEGLSLVEKERLTTLIDRILKNQDAVDIDVWLRAVEVTSFRAGLLLCGDLHVATTALKRRPPEMPGLALEDVVRHLVAFSVSEVFFELRQAVGISIEP